MKKLYQALKICLVLFFSSGTMVVLSTVYLKQELGDVNSLLEETAFVIAGKPISTYGVAHLLCLVWFYLFGWMFLLGNKTQLSQLLVELDRLHGRLDELLEPSVSKDRLLDFRNLFLSKIFRLIGRMNERTPPPFVRRFGGMIVVETLDRKILTSLASHVAQLTRAANNAFGRAGMLSAVSLVFLYRLLSSVPTAIFSWKALIFVVGGYLCGHVIGYSIIQTAHKIFTIEGIGYLTSKGDFN